MHRSRYWWYLFHKSNVNKAQDHCIVYLTPVNFLRYNGTSTSSKIGRVITSVIVRNVQMVGEEQGKVTTIKTQQGMVLFLSKRNLGEWTYLCTI